MTYATAPYLIVTEPAPLSGQVISLTAGCTTVGRGQVNMRLDDPRVSDRHAALYAAAGGQVTVEDLGSLNGTTLNGHSVRGRQPVRPGDVLGFGPVQVRYEIPRLSASNTNGVPRQPTGPSFAVHAQQGHISNVGHDQYNYNSYLQTVVQQRESFLREVAAARTRARRVVIFGLILFLGGAAVAIAFQVVFANRFESLNEQSDPNSFFKGFGAAFAAAGVSTFGLLLTIVGIVLHVVATARRRRVNDNFPIRPPS